MKIGQGQLQSSQLIEQMQKAHAERKDELGEAKAFSVDAAGGGQAEGAKSPLTEGLAGIAEDVVTGRGDEDSEVRRRGLGGDVAPRFSGPGGAGATGRTWPSPDRPWRTE